MSLQQRRWVVIAVIGIIILLAQFWMIGEWLERHGVLAWAGKVRREFLTGTALVVIAVMLFLAGSRHKRLGERRCRVCSSPLAQGSYCPSCGSRC